MSKAAAKAGVRSHDGSPLAVYRGRFFGSIPLPSGEWKPGQELTLDRGDERGELSEQWW